MKKYFVDYESEVNPRGRIRKILSMDEQYHCKLRRDYENLCNERTVKKNYQRKNLEDETIERIEGRIEPGYVLIDIDTASIVTGFSRGTLLNWRKGGLYPDLFVLIGNRLRFDLNAYWKLIEYEKQRSIERSKRIRARMIRNGAIAPRRIIRRRKGHPRPWQPKVTRYNRPENFEGRRQKMIKKN
jgi:hypothetical protein